LFTALAIAFDNAVYADFPPIDVEDVLLVEIGVELQEEAPKATIVGVKLSPIIC